MCRLIGYAGPPIALERIVTRPRHSLLKQSQHAHEAKLAVNGDGFGMAWYMPDEAAPGQYRDVLPAWSDGNLPSLCRVIRSGMFLAHVRAGTTGATSRDNCHPFTHGRWSFAHNGQIAGFDGVRRGLEAALPDDLYAKRQGTTDSEVFFLTMLHLGLEDDPLGAAARAIARVETAQGGPAANRFACVMSDGARIIGFRASGDGRAPTLYLSRAELDHGGTALASEPLDGVAQNWIALDEDAAVTITAEGAIFSSLTRAVGSGQDQATSPKKMYPAP